MATVGRVLFYCQNVSCRCDMHRVPRLVPAVDMSRSKTINIFNIMTAIRLEGFCSDSFRYILRKKCVRPTSYVNIAYNSWMMNQ
jgi:hypothetical protein